MNRNRALAKEIVEQYGRDGTLSAESLESAAFGVWDELTPGVLVVAAFCLAAVEDSALAERIAQTGDVMLVRLISGDFQAIELDADDAARNWELVVAQLSGYVRRPGASPDAIDVLLRQAEDLWSEVLESGEMARPRLRDGENGPWDAAETPLPATVERLNYGVLKVPRLEGMQIGPLRADGHIVGVVLSLGDHAFSLQAFGAPLGPVWGKARQKVIQDLRNRGGTAEDTESDFGSEVRAQVPVTKDGRQVLQPTRVVGCDGPGRLLRGVYGGPKALADVVDPRAYHLFTQTVVDLSGVASHVDASQEISALDVRWPTTQ